MTRLNMNTIVMATALSVAAPGIFISPASAAQWLAPAPQERLTADWVKDIAAQLRKEKWREVFMNAPFGSPQASMLGLLNEAAIAMKEGEAAYARDLIRHAVGILDDGVEQGWYSRRHIEPLKGLILTRALEGLEQTKKQAKGSKPSGGKDSRGEQAGYTSTEGFDEPLFGGPDDYDLYGEDNGRRWTGYTENRRGGITNRRERRGGEEFEQDNRGKSGQDRASRRSVDRQSSKSSDYREARERDRRADPRDVDWDRLGPQERDRMRSLEQNDEERMGRVGAMRPKPSARGEESASSRRGWGHFTPDELERESRASQRMSREDYEQYEGRRGWRGSDDMSERRWPER